MTLRFRFVSVGLWAAALTTAASAGAATCEELRAEIEAKVGAAGVSRFSVVVIEAATPLPLNARAVGSCDRGSKTIVYQQQGGGAPAAARAVGSNAILTECRDGTQSIGGDCKKSP